MATNIRLTQTQRLTLNPVLHSFIEFLPMTRLEFIEKIKIEVESNPMLELEAPDIQLSRDEPDQNQLQKRLERADSSYLNSYEDQGFFKRDKDRIDKNRAIELFAPAKVTLTDHLITQALTVFNEKEMKVAEHIIYNLNSDGYLDVAVETIATSIQSTPEEFERIRGIIKTFDPPGVASRNLAECLLSQLNPDQTDKQLIELIKNHLDEIARTKFNDIMKAMGIDTDRLNNLMLELKKLNPKPSANFEKTEIDYAEVDLMLIKEKDKYKVVMIEEGMPQLILSQHYENMLQETTDKKTISYLKKKQRSARLFLDGLDMRKSIIQRIAEYLVKVQQDFLDFGKNWKRPLIMKDVARELGVSESTISRAVNSKFMTSEKGLLSLREFFTYGLKGEFGFNHSVETIKNKLKEIISAESRIKPLSDELISQKMADLGIKISRRTIRNYRSEMRIPSSSKRKEEYKLKGEQHEY